jgi:hypothetical protein
MPHPPLPSEVETALREGRPIDAIRLLRKAAGLGLKEAKDIIDGRVHVLPPKERQPDAPVTRGGSPGEVPRHPDYLLWIAFVALLLVLY